MNQADANRIIAREAAKLLDDFFDSRPAAWWSNVVAADGWPPSEADENRLAKAAARLSHQLEQKGSDR